MFRRKRDDARNERCGVHGFAHASARCRACRDAYCGECLVYPSGPRRQPYCVGCALVAAGIRRPSR
jgi:hypothetical protein